MKKRIIAVLAVVALTYGASAVKAQVFVQNGPTPVILSGTVTGNDGSKTKVSDIQLTFVLTANILSNTTAFLASSVTVTNVIDPETSNTVTIATDISGTVYETDSNTGVFIVDKNGGVVEYADVFFGSAPSNAVLYVDAKLKVDKKTGDSSLSSAKVSGIWATQQGIISGTIKPDKSK